MPLPRKVRRPLLGLRGLRQVARQRVGDDRRETRAALARELVGRLPHVPVRVHDIERDVLAEPGGSTWAEAALVVHVGSIARPYHGYMWYAEPTQTAEPAPRLDSSGRLQGHQEVSMDNGTAWVATEIVATVDFGTVGGAVAGLRADGGTETYGWLTA